MSDVPLPSSSKSGVRPKVCDWANGPVRYMPVCTSSTMSR